MISARHNITHVTCHCKHTRMFNWGHTGSGRKAGVWDRISNYTQKHTWVPLTFYHLIGNDILFSVWPELLGAWCSKGSRMIMRWCNANTHRLERFCLTSNSDGQTVAFLIITHSVIISMITLLCHAPGFRWAAFSSIKPCLRCFEIWHWPQASALLFFLPFFSSDILGRLFVSSLIFQPFLSSQFEQI